MEAASLRASSSTQDSLHTLPAQAKAAHDGYVLVPANEAACRGVAS